MKDNWIEKKIHSRFSRDLPEPMDKGKPGDGCQNVS